MKNKKLEILIVEDGKENIKAAKQFFDTQRDVKIDFAMNYEQGLKKINNKLYAGALFDLELPKTENAEPEKLGYELAKIAGEYTLPWLIITSGIDHHDNKASFTINKLSDKKGNEIFATPKTDPKAWKIAYERLKEYPLRELFESRKRYEKFVGKKFSYPKGDPIRKYLFE